MHERVLVSLEIIFGMVKFGMSESNPVCLSHPYPLKICMHLILIDAERSPITYAILLPDILFKVLCRPLVLFIGFDIDINNLKRRYNNLHHHKGRVSHTSIALKCVNKIPSYIFCHYAPESFIM